jgi:Recombination endonuclease VII
MAMYYSEKQASRAIGKSCATCHQFQSFAAFPTVKEGYLRYGPSCIDCVQRRKPAARHRRIKTYYGLTKDDYEAMYATQHAQCAICLRTLNEKGRHPLHVDHDHGTGKIRGLLCAACNHGLGRFEDNPQRLLSAIAYLQSGGSCTNNNFYDTV